jgi:endonuclease/exonuclease/phosphatase (EEP) superfamily protein YafD
VQAAARLARLVAGLAILASVAAWCGRLHWLLELITHFRFQYVVALASVTVVVAAARWWRQAAVLALLTIVQSLALWPLYFTRAAPLPTGVATYRAVSINVFAGSKSFDKVKTFIQRESPDFIVLSEVTQPWADVLAELQDEYPYSKIDVRPGAFGIALLSRIELERIDLYQVGRGYRSAIVGQFELDGQLLSVVGAHPYPPRSAFAAQTRAQQLAELANVVGWQQGEVLLLGDLNTTGWSPHFGDLLAATELSDSRLGFGRQSTWPSVMPSCLRIAIDHALVSGGIRVHDRRVGPYVGSDHLPIVIDFSITADASP